MSDTLTPAERFFYEHAGYSYDRTETAEQGRVSTARALAAAEARLTAGPYLIDAVPDDVPWDGDEPYDGPLWIVTLWSVAESAHQTDLGSIGSVACEEGGWYMRVVAAELALEHLPKDGAE